MSRQRLVKIDEGSYQTEDGLNWLRRDFDGIYKWNLLRPREGGGWDIVDSRRTFRELRLLVEA